MARMSLDRFARIVRRVVDRLPPDIAAHLDNVVVDVEDEPTAEFLRRAGFSDAEIAAGDTLYGYFEPRVGLDAPELLDNPDRIVIFKNPLEDDFPDRRDLMVEIRKTVVHEIAHHFGWSDRDLEAFDADPDPFADG